MESQYLTNAHSTVIVDGLGLTLQIRLGTEVDWCSCDLIASYGLENVEGIFNGQLNMIMYVW